MPADAELVSAKAAGRPLPFAPLAPGGGASRLLRSETIELASGDQRVLAEILLGGPSGQNRFTAELTSVDDFNARFGFDWHPGPAPETYGGWRLP